MAFKFDVVISGISGRFPECDDIDTFKKKLYEGNSNEFITNNEKKWARGFKKNRYGDKVAVPDATGKYTKEIEFDYRLFKFNSLFGQSTDVVNRKILEPSFEAIVDAGINPYSLDGANVGVFMTGGVPEREINASSMENTMKRSFILGNARTMAPNRLSYALNLRGPSYAFHADPLGGFAALKIAKELVSDGSIEAAVVAVASNLIDPTFSYLYMYLDLLTVDECCRSLDKNANGFVRSECSVVFFLQREQEAKRQYAKLVLCDNIFEGLSSHTLLGYDEKYLKNSLSKIYERNANTAVAEEIAFVELTGCAIKRFELAEANAVADILCEHRTTPLMVGSIKSNVGHTEVASGFLSILKTLLALDSQVIAPNANFSEVNEEIRAFCGKQMQVVDKITELCGNIAAVNTVGLWGAVNHVILQNNVRKKEKNSDTIPRLLLLSGRTEDGLRQVFEKIGKDSCNVEAIALANDVFETDMPFHIYRGFTILPKTGQTAVVDKRMKTQRPICFVFSGMGSQWNGMGKQLLDFPIIAEVIKRCDAVLKLKSIDIYEVLLSEDPTMFDNITMSFVAIICMQIALVEVLKKLNIVPDLMLGHSAGECGCAYADGCLTLEEAILINYSRGIASNSTTTIKGKMAAVGKGYKEVRDDIPKTVEVACHNAVNNCTLSGPAEDVDAYVEILKNQEIFAKSVNVANIAYHSRYIKPLAPKHLELLKKIIREPKKRSSKWISTSVPKSEWHLPTARQCSAEYFTNNLLNPVLFEEACHHVPNDAVCIEIAPHGLLQAILKRSLPQTCTNISLTLRSDAKENLNFLLTSIGELYIAGCEPAVNNLYPLIEYPVSRGTPSISSYCTWFYGDRDVVTPHLNRARPCPLSYEKVFLRINEDEEFNFLKYHQINDSIILPPSFLLCLVWRMLSIQQNVKMDKFPVLFEKIKVHKNIKISISKLRSISILIQGSGSFELLSRYKTSPVEKVILTGKVEFIRDESEVLVTDFDSVESKYLLEADDINTILKNVGFHLGECFQLLTGIKIEDSEFQGRVKWTGNWVTFLDSIMKFQMFSDLQKSKLCFLKSIRRMIIIPSAMKSQTSGDQVIAKYCRVTKYLQCNGTVIYDARWKTDNRLVSSKLTSSLKTKKFKFNNNRLQPENDPESLSKLDWSTFQYQSSSLVDSNDDKSKFTNFLTDIRIESICVEFVRPDFTAINHDFGIQNEKIEEIIMENDSIKSFGIEFSGLNARGKKLMGLTMVDQNEPISTLNPSLNWRVPEEWTLAEAATIPFMYVHVFSILKKFENSLYIPSPKILINAGEDMLNVELCVTTCLTKKFIVYVVVSNAEHVERLKQNCPLLEKSCILLNNDGRFDYEVMNKTKGEGVNVVINYQRGIESFTATTNCVSNFAYYIETVQSNLDENYEIGMYNFLKALNFAVVPRNIPYLLNQPDDIKKQLHRDVDDGIKSGLVRPIDRLNTNELSIRVNNNKNVLNVRNSKTTILNGNAGMAPDNIIFKRNHSHIILGGKYSEEAWINLICWLIERGGTNFIVLVEKLPTESQISQRLKCLLTNETITVSFMPLERLISVDDAIQLIRITNTIAPVDSILFVFLDSCLKKISYMDMASQKVERNIKLISLYSGGLEAMELRQTKEVPGFVLHGEIFPQNISTVMTEFEKLLSRYDTNDNQYIPYQMMGEKKELNLEDKLSSLKNYLPKNIASLERIGRCLSEKVEFVEMTSRCPKLAHCRGVLPIFIIPSLHASELQPLLQSLMYPVFCASLSENCSSVDETAEKLFEHLKLIQPVGPVTLIGETWNSTVAGELSSMIKRSGRDFRMFSLHGNPIEWRETIKSLNLTNCKDFENVFIKIYGEILAKYMFSFDETRADGGESIPARKSDSALVRRCLRVLRRQFINICDYNDNNTKLQNTVLFISTVPHNIPILSKSCDIVRIKEDNYEQFIRSSVIKKTINKRAMFSWNV